MSSVLQFRLSSIPQPRCLASLSCPGKSGKMGLMLRLFINLTPFIPLSLKGEGEEILERGKTPLSPPTPFPYEGKGVRG